LSVTSYSFEDVAILIDGVPATGFDEGDNAIRVSRNVPPWSLTTGADGDSVALKSANRSGTLTLRLLQSSLTNAFLTAKLKIQDAGNLSPFPFVMRDANGLDLVISDSAFVEGPPEAIYGERHNAREWTLILPAVDIFMAGAA